MQLDEKSLNKLCSTHWNQYIENHLKKNNIAAIEDQVYENKMPEEGGNTTDVLH
tara:strand:- start:1624 stop:1785 length:162 start_codon:yes stop_codon:yes gene_type:complete